MKALNFHWNLRQSKFFEIIQKFFFGFSYISCAFRSSFKMKHKRVLDYNQSIPEHLFRGHFVVLTVFALLELPPGV